MFSIKLGMEQFSEEQIWAAFKAGSDEALSYIYHSYVHKLYNYGRQFVPETDVVKDAIQDLFCEMIVARERLSETTSVKFYLYASLKRKLARYAEKQAKFVSVTTDTEAFALDIPQEGDLFTQLFSDDTNKLIADACAKLPQKQREAIALYFFEGMSYEEIAKLMAMTKVKSARALVYRALESLSESLGVPAHIVELLCLWLILGERVGS